MASVALEGGWSKKNIGEHDIIQVYIEFALRVCHAMQGQVG